MKLAKCAFALALAACATESGRPQPPKGAAASSSATPVSSTAGTLTPTASPVPSSPTPIATNAAPSAAPTVGETNESKLQASDAFDRARSLLADAQAALGASDYATARTKAASAVAALLELPDAGRSSDWVNAMQNAAIAAFTARDIRTANAAFRWTVDVGKRFWPPDSGALLGARDNLALTIGELGDLEGERRLHQEVLDARLRTLPEDSNEVQISRQNLGAALWSLGELEQASALIEKVLEVRSRVASPDDSDLLEARMNVAMITSELGDASRARVIEERVVSALASHFPPDHPELLHARQLLADSLEHLGDLQAARVLEEQLLESESRNLPDDDPILQSSRAGLALTLKALGDFAGARALEEKVLEVRTRTMPDEHPQLQRARQNLAATLQQLGDAQGALELERRVVEIDSRVLHPDDRNLLIARNNLAVTLDTLGDFDGALGMIDETYVAQSRALPSDDSNLQTSRFNLVDALIARCVRGSHGGPVADVGDVRRRAVEIVGAAARASIEAARDAIVGGSTREAEERCAQQKRVLDNVLASSAGIDSFAPLHELDALAFELSETTRCAALASAALGRKAANAPNYAELRGAQKRARDELARLAQSGTTSSDFDRARKSRDDAERSLVEAARGLIGGAIVAGFDVDTIARRLTSDDAAIGFRRYTRLVATDPTSGAVQLDSREELCAFVLRRAKDGSAVLSRVELGPIEPIEQAVRAWREVVGASIERGLGVRDASRDLARERGARVRELVFDPLLDATSGATHWIVALDDVLHLVPLDALPARDDGEFVGEHWRIETRATLSELASDAPSPKAGALIAFGGASFNSPPLDPSAEDVTKLDASDAPIGQGSERLRGTIWERGFGPLPFTGEEAREIAALFDEVFADHETSRVFDKRRASRATFEKLAPSASWLHVATHGWFAAESIHSWSDQVEHDDRTGGPVRETSEMQVKGMSPMLLCGLALAGANLPEIENGRAPGLITAEEIAALDLSACRLVVLSACDTNVGVRRAGQGVASLQKALQMAGAQSVITSLWKVPDEATKELMLDFYRRLWVEKKPKWQALEEAKKKLRAAKNDDGSARYSTRDWAAWVLTGDPN